MWVEVVYGKSPIISTITQKEENDDVYSPFISRTILNMNNESFNDDISKSVLTRCQNVWLILGPAKGLTEESSESSTYGEWFNKHVKLNRRTIFLFMYQCRTCSLDDENNNKPSCWAIVFAFFVLECGTLLWSLRLWFFKIRKFTWKEFGMVFVFETLHVIGLCLLAFKILPELDIIQGANLTNCLCLVPSILCQKNFSPCLIYAM